MLIKALNEYYDILARNDKVCKDGFSRQNITHMIMLRKDGTVSDIINVEQESEPAQKKCHVLKIGSLKASAG